MIHDFAGCPAADVVAAVGLQLSDLFPERLKPTTPQERRELKQYAKEANWRAALNVLSREAGIVLIAGVDMRKGTAPTDADLERLGVAVSRIQAAREVLQ